MTSRPDELRRCATAECENEFRSPKVHSPFCPLRRSSIGRRAKRPAAALLKRRSNLMRHSYVRDVRAFLDQGFHARRDSSSTDEDERQRRSGTRPHEMDRRTDWRRARLRMENSELTFEAWVSGFADFLLRGRPYRLVQNRLQRFVSVAWMLR